MEASGCRRKGERMEANYRLTVENDKDNTLEFCEWYATEAEARAAYKQKVVECEQAEDTNTRHVELCLVLDAEACEGASV